MRHAILFSALHTYISNRNQAVVINNYISSWVEVPSGLPQGSLLGPLLFLIFVNDIDKCFHSSELLCFADDMKIFSPISSPTEALALQLDLQRLDDYCSLNKLDLYPSKCSIITFSRKPHVIKVDYFLKGQKIQRCDNIRDLGVTHDSKLLFDRHFDNIVSKASQSLGFIMRMSNSFNDAKTFKILYCTFVRGILEYASQVWSPRYEIYASRLENIQRKFIKYLCYRLKIDYKAEDYLRLCARFHILPLVTRRHIADVTY